AAMSNAWRTEMAEGFLAHFIANESLAQAIAKDEPDRNTDDRTLVEFGFARGLGETERFNMNELAGLARSRHADRPLRARGIVDWNLVDANRASFNYINQLPQGASAELLARHRVAISYDNNDLAGVVNDWRAHSFPPANSGEVTAIAESLADAGSAS